METKVITPGKIVPYKCCIPTSNVSVKILTQTFLLISFVIHFQVLSIKFIKNEKKCKQTPYVIDKAVLGKTCVLSVTDVAEGQ